MKKGFTLIELLIVITIIGILAVAFLPTLLGAPAKGRDTQRIADLQKIQKVIINEDLGGVNKAPNASGCVVDGATFNVYKTALGGVLPTPPRTGDATGRCTGSYEYDYNPGGQDVYKYALLTVVEDETKANVDCSDPFDGTTTAGVVALNPPGATPATWCYAILTQ